MTKHDQTAKVLTTLRVSGGMTPRDIAKQTGINRKTLSYHLKKLKDRGQIHQTAGYVWRCTSAVTQVPAAVAATKPPAAITLPTKKNGKTLESLLLTAIDALDEALEYARTLDARNGDLEAGATMLLEALNKHK